VGCAVCSFAGRAIRSRSPRAAGAARSLARPRREPPRSLRRAERMNHVPASPAPFFCDTLWYRETMSQIACIQPLGLAFDLSWSGLGLPGPARQTPPRHRWRPVSTTTDVQPRCATARVNAGFPPWRRPHRAKRAIDGASWAVMIRVTGPGSSGHASSIPRARKARANRSPATRVNRHAPVVYPPAWSPRPPSVGRNDQGCAASTNTMPGHFGAKAFVKGQRFMTRPATHHHHEGSGSWGRRSTPMQIRDDCAKPFRLTYRCLGSAPTDAGPGL